MAALGAETASGDFEVFEYCFAGLPSQPALEPASPEGEWVAIASGLQMGSAGDAADLRTEMLVEFLLGEAGEEEASLALGCTPSPRIPQLIGPSTTGPGGCGQGVSSHSCRQLFGPARYRRNWERRAEKGARLP